MSGCPTDREIEASLDGAPAERGASPVEAHLEECPRCCARAERIVALDAALASGLIAADRDARRISPRLVSRLRAIGEEELARRAERRARARAAEAPRVRASARLARGAPRAGRVPTAVAAGLALAVLVPVLIRSAGGPEKEEAFPLSAARAPVPALRLDGGPERLAASTPRAPAVAAPASSPPAADGPTSPGPHSQEGAAETAGAAEPAAEAAVAFAGGHADPASGCTREAPGASAAAAPAPAATLADPSGAPVLAERPDPDPATVERPGLPSLPAGPPAPVRIAHVRGDLRLRREGEGAFVRTGSAPLLVLPGDTLRAEAPGASITLARGTELALRPGTAIRLAAETASSGEPRGIAVALEEGEVVADVVPDVAENGLCVRTRGGDARAVGTRFAVQCGRGALATRVAVLEGRVEVCSPAGTETIGRGECAFAEPGARPGPRRMTDSEAAAFAFADRVRARRTTLFQASFDRGPGLFDGVLVARPGGAPGDRALELRPIHGDQHWGERATVRRAGLFRARPGTEIRFAYFLREPSTILVQAYDDARGALYFTALNRPILGRWATASILVDDLEWISGSTKVGPREGEPFTTLEILAGRSELPVHLLIDDVTIVERD